MFIVFVAVLSDLVATIGHIIGLCGSAVRFGCYYKPCLLQYMAVLSDFIVTISHVYCIV